MASTVTNYSNNINIAYPVAGKDNDSQGFRTNFTNIQNAFSIAAGEITQLQVNGVNLNKATNDLGFSSVLTRSQLQNSGQVAVLSASSATNIAGVLPVDYSLGSYQQITVSTGSMTLSVSNWPPSGVYSNIRLAITALTSGTITFNTSQSVPPGASPLSADIPYATTSTVPNTTVWDLWSADGGQNVYVKFVSGPF